MPLSHILHKSDDKILTILVWFLLILCKIFMIIVYINRLHSYIYINLTSEWHRPIYYLDNILYNSHIDYKMKHWTESGKSYASFSDELRFHAILGKEFLSSLKKMLENVVKFKIKKQSYTLYEIISTEYITML